MWCPKRFYEGLKGLHKTSWGATKKCENKNLTQFLFQYNFQKCTERKGKGQYNFQKCMGREEKGQYNFQKCAGREGKGQYNFQKCTGPEGKGEDLNE